MASLYTHKDSNIRKTWMLLTVFFIAVIAIGWGISWYLQSPSILYAAIIFALLMNVWSYWFSDKLVIKMTGAKLMPDTGSYQDVHNIVENLAITAGLPKPKLYLVEDPAPNAFATLMLLQQDAIQNTRLSQLLRGCCRLWIAMNWKECSRMNFLTSAIVTC
jgi:heat shock protein HtpX